jgi:major membrane immunogen (membrane-anchored lipoprotein)
MKKKLLIAGGIFLAMILVVFILVTNGLSEGANVQIHGIDLTNVADGDYAGEYNFKRWSETAIVSVRNGEIVDIQADEKNMPDILSDYNIYEEIIGRVIATQNTTVEQYHQKPSLRQ